MSFFLRYRAVVVLLAVVPLTGCLFRSRKVVLPINDVQLKSATQQELIDYINTQAEKVQSVQATVDIDTTVGGVKKGKVTDYEEIRGYLLLRKPAMLRLIGLMPIVRNRAFDMVSDGQRFKLWIPSKNRFVIGRNDMETHNPSLTLESLRPQYIYDALLLHRIDPQNEIAVLENDTELVTEAKSHKVSRADYVIDVVRKGAQGWVLSRKVVFSRTDLLPHRQLIYDGDGNVRTNAVYERYKDENGINFPWQIETAMPQAEYDITLNIVKLELNEPLPDDRFALEQPGGAEVVDMDKKDAHSASAPAADK